MNLALPTRLPIFQSMVFIGLLGLVQLLERTDPLYTLLCCTFFLLSVFAFNVAGGFTRPSGAWIFFFSLLVVDVGTVYKAILGQPAQTNLQQPLLLMSAYTATMAGMLVAAFVARKIATTQDGMAAVLRVPRIDFSQSAFGCLITYWLIQIGTAVLPNGGGAVLHAVTIINPFLPLAIIFGTIAAVRGSGGARSLNLTTLLAIGYGQYYGMLSFSKQAMFTPFVCWLIGAFWARFRLRLVHVVVILAFGVAAQEILVPLSTLRDEVETGSNQERFGIVYRYVTHPAQLRQHVKDWEPPSDFDWRMQYYGSVQNLWNRLTMLPNDSVLVSFSDQGHFFGYLPVRAYFENWVPHIIDPHKLEGVQVGGNTYMHEMGGLAEADTTTGISFSPTAEAFHIDGWRAVLLLCPAIFLLVFVTVDAVCGDLRRQPWGLLPMLVFAHVAPEAGLAGAISAVWLGNIATILAMVACGYFTPILAMLLTGRIGGRGLATAPSPRRLQMTG